MESIVVTDNTIKNACCMYSMVMLCVLLPTLRATYSTSSPLLPPSRHACLVVEYGCSTSTSRNSSIMSKRAVLPTLYIHCCRLYVASVASYVTQQQHYGASIIPAVVTY